VGEIVQFMTSHRDIGWLHLEPGHPEVRLAFPAVGLRPGTYRVQLSLSQGSMHDILKISGSSYAIRASSQTACISSRVIGT
jgi:hypothetical protein